MLRTQNLGYRYAGADHELTFPDLDCAAGRPHLLLGPSGAGKTTLLQLLAGLRAPHRGSVWIDGQDLYALPLAARDRFRGRNVGLVFQTAHFVRSVNVVQNLLLAQTSAGLPPDRARALSLLADLGLEAKAGKSPEALSVGERQRVGIARAVLNEPRVLLADEPTSALDDGNARRVLDLLTDAAQRTGAALLIVTHDNRLTDLVDQKTSL